MNPELDLTTLQYLWATAYKHLARWKALNLKPELLIVYIYPTEQYSRLLDFCLYSPGSDWYSTAHRATNISDGATIISNRTFTHIQLT